MSTEADEEQFEKLFDNLPMHLNLGDFDVRSHIGWAEAVRDVHTGEVRLAIRLSGEASEKLGDLTKVFDLKAIGFAGYKKSSPIQGE